MPAHQVTIGKGFFMGEYEVTQAQWQAVMKNNPSHFKGDDLPVEEVSWDDAQEFIRRLNARGDGYTYRLPSEAEWEYACRAGTTGDFAGDLDSMAWYGGTEWNRRAKTFPVGSKQANGFGLYDMNGNVSEWVQDWYHDSYAGAPSDGGAWLSGGDQKRRVVRGGAWSDDAARCRSAYRKGLEPDFHSHLVVTSCGFRVVAVGTQSSQKSEKAESRNAPATGVIDELNGSSLGETYGVTYVDALDGQGAVFSRENETRIQYRNIPGEGTLEWWIYVKSGYHYSDYHLTENEPNALIFTTVGPDVWYPGGAGINVNADGTISLDMVTTKYNGPKQIVTAVNTNFRFNQWHSIGISFGGEGQYIMLDGVLVASEPHNTQKLGRGGTHDAPVDIPTVGELTSSFWDNNRYDAGFEGIVDRFRISNKQRDWYLSAQSPR
jgi:hypothetical protein